MKRVLAALVAILTVATAASAQSGSTLSLDEAIGIDFADASAYVFDSETGERIRGRVA